MNITIIADGLRQYKAEYMNENPSVITSSPTEISKSGADLCSLLVPQFIPALPVDPMLNSPDIEEIDCESEYNTGYTVVLNPDGTITVSAPHAENEATISVSR